MNSLLMASNSFSRRRLFGEGMLSCCPVDVEPSVCTLALVIPLLAVPGFTVDSESDKLTDVQRDLRQTSYSF